MLQSFIIVLREGFESFLLVAIILAYLRKTGRGRLSLAVYGGIAVALILSAALGYFLAQGIIANQALWEGVLGLLAIALVASLLLHMRKVGPQLRQKMEARLAEVSARPTGRAAFAGVFLFTVLMISREGMETALLLLQVRDGRLILGALLGLSGAALFAWLWLRFSHLINLKRFFQVTSLFLLLFMAQVAIYSFHEFAEAGIFPNSDYLHEATETFSPDGLYGKWFSLLMVAGCAAWLLGAWLFDRKRAARGRSVSLEQA